MVRAQTVANQIVKSFRAKGGISNLKLQKLLYYAQAWNLALYGKPLFRDRIEAWVHGPVVPPVFGAFKHFKWLPISSTVGSAKFPDQYKPHLAEVIRVYGGFSPTELERLTHREAPWKEARGGIPNHQPSRAIITHDAMKRFYGARLRDAEAESEA